ncbi:MAG: hypothetical protein ABI809_02815 [Caldimonas sp.]
MRIADDFETRCDAVGAASSRSFAIVLRAAKRCCKLPREDKKKARRMIDAPSNKTYGNCLLGLHCIHKNSAGDRAVAGFLLVARGQQEKLSTDCQQRAVEDLGVIFRPFQDHWIFLTGPDRCLNRRHLLPLCE